jgi:hypothetical protein
MDEPNYLSPTVAADARDACKQLLQVHVEDVYWRAVDVMSVLGLALPDDAPGRLYVVWGALTDKWELNPGDRSDAEELMCDAARELLVIGDDALELDRYLQRWYELLRLPV